MKFKTIITNRITADRLLFAAPTYAIMSVVSAKDDQEPKLIRPRDLSIYPEESKEKKTENEDNWEPTLALGSIKKIREEIISINQQLSKVKDRVYVFVQTGISHTQTLIDDLKEEKNTTLRAGFVVGSGLAGLLVAARKGKFKKLVYTTTGASVAFYVGYPKESEEVAKIIKRYSIISYYFINNVSKDLTGLELPPLPAPKNEQEDNSGESKANLKELLFLLLDDYLKKPLEYLKKYIFDEKNGPTDKSK